MNLFAKKFINVLLDGEPVKLPFRDLFDPNLYDELCLVSYVSSFKFFFNNIKGFKKVTLILGEDEVSKRFLSLNNLVELELLEQINVIRAM